MKIDWKTELPRVEQALEAISADEALLNRVQVANPWFVPALVRQAVLAMRPWWKFDHFPLPHPPVARKIGIIMAGNVPFVGLHDLVSVLLSGHQAVVKLSGKDSLLLPALLEKLSPDLPVQVVEKILPEEIDFLLATGSDNTARYLQHDFQGIPQVIRKNRFSVAVLRGDESPEDWQGLARDILLYHGMGCRSVSNLLLPPQMDLNPLWEAVEAFPQAFLANDWFDVVRWEQAVHRMQHPETPPSTRLQAEFRDSLSPARVGLLHLIPYHTEQELENHLQAAHEKIQCVVGTGRPVGFGRSQFPEWDDFADGLNVMEVLRGLN